MQWLFKAKTWGETIAVERKIKETKSIYCNGVKECLAASDCPQDVVHEDPVQRTRLADQGGRRPDDDPVRDRVNPYSPV